VLDPISVLEQRRDFLGDIIEIAEACNWSTKDIKDLHNCLWNALVEIDNLTLETYEKTKDQTLSHAIWEAKMEELQRWLGMIFGVKIKYI